MLTAGETAGALYGLSRLIRLDDGGLQFFNASREGFWNSFWVAVVVLPVYLIQSLVFYDRADLPVGPLTYAIIELETYVISWVLFPLIMIRVSTWLDRGHRFFVFAVAYNWFQLVISLVILPLALLNGLGALPQGLAALLLGATAAFLVYTWFIAHKALDIGAGTAVGIVILDVLLSILINGTTDAMIGG